MVKEAVDSELARRPDLRPVIEVHLPETGETRKIEGLTHQKFAEVVRLVSSGIPVLLVEPAGALGLPFTFNSMSAGVTESCPTPMATGPIGPRPFVTTYRDGGVHLFAEVDAASRAPTRFVFCHVSTMVVPLAFFIPPTQPLDLPPPSPV